jgi:hypothetical protein
MSEHLPSWRLLHCISHTVLIHPGCRRDDLTLQEEPAYRPLQLRVVNRSYRTLSMDPFLLNRTTDG